MWMKLESKTQAGKLKLAGGEDGELKLQESTLK